MYRKPTPDEQVNHSSVTEKSRTRKPGGGVTCACTVVVCVNGLHHFILLTLHSSTQKKHILPPYIVLSYFELIITLFD